MQKKSFNQIFIDVYTNIIPSIPPQERNAMGNVDAYLRGSFLRHSTFNINFHLNKNEPVEALSYFNTYSPHLPEIQQNIPLMKNLFH
ncbi:hypothetical protein DID78_01905 [Candidatus Marinamargulisbacteria bacterium SCGC AG-343-D04]|nr:hypothetical protein DID78_01905 [Candidatus Marinamargulisbacteria bacterium SCGC AG-343-D04]